MHERAAAAEHEVGLFTTRSSHRNWILAGAFITASVAAFAIAFAMGGHPDAPALATGSDFDEMARRAEEVGLRVEELETRMKDLERAIGERAVGLDP